MIKANYRYLCIIINKESCTLSYIIKLAIGCTSIFQSYLSIKYERYTETHCKIEKHEQFLKVACN